MELSEKQLNLPAGALIKTTLVDFPGRVACSYFLKGCNLRCPYCYNKELILGTESEEDLSSPLQVIEHLEKRKNVLTGFVISGGEALLNPLTPFLIKEGKKRNLKIKLDTNGTLPELLEKLILNPETKPDFIAVDIKTSPEKYENFLLQKNNKISINFETAIQKTIHLVQKYPSTEREFRTVLVPPLVQAEDIKKIASMLPEDASWQFAQFRNENCLNPEYNNILPYLDSEARKLVELAQSFIPGAALR